MSTLWPKQAEQFGEVREAFRRHQSVLMQSPTGSGKTQMGTHAAKSATEKGHAIIWLAHRKELLEQTSKTFSKADVPHSVLMSGRHHNPRMRATIASVGTLVNRLNRIDPPRLLIVDECHHSVAGSFDKIIRWAEAGGGKILGLTATPWRLSGEGLDSHYQHMVRGPSVAWLIENGFLSDYRAYAPAAPDLTGVHTLAGDFARNEIEQVMTGKAILAGCVTHWLRYAAGKRTIGFAVSIEHSRMMVEEFNRAGIPAAHVDANTPPPVRRQHILNFATGHLTVLFNVDLFSEGFDLSAIADRDVPIECVIQARPTKSLTLHLQQCLDSATEVLSKRGWLRHDQIGMDDEVAGYELATGAIVWCPVREVVRRPLADGEAMYAIRAPHLDIRVTGGHDMIVRARSKTCRHWGKQPAEAVAHRKSLFRIPVAGIEAVGPAPLSDAEIQFLGWFLTDGTRNAASGQVTISQSASKPEHCERIRDVLNACGFKFGEHRAKRTGEWARYADLIQFSVSRGNPRSNGLHLRGWQDLEPWLHKTLPVAYESLDDCQLSILLEAMNLGDGNNSSRTISWVRRTMTIACGTNETLADRLQSLCVRRGFRCNKSKQHYEGRSAWYYLHIKRKMSSTIAGSDVRSGTICGKPYTRTRLVADASIPGEQVWCVRNDLGTLVIRRNGKVAVVGNCGRGLRRKPQPAILIDLCGNLARLGLPDHPHEWTLEGRPKKGRGTRGDEPAPLVRRCSACQVMFAITLAACPHCGAEQAAAGGGRKVEEIEGELREIDREQARRERLREQAGAQSLEQLIELGKAKGYKSPERWASHVYTARLQKQNRAG